MARHHGGFRGVAEIKRIVLILCLALAIALPANALAGLAFPPDNDYQGRLEGDPNTYLGFDVFKRHHRPKRVNRVAMAIPLNCYSGDHAIVDVTVEKPYDVINLSFLSPRRHRHHRHSPRRFLFGLEETPRRIETDAGPGTVELIGLLQRHGRATGYVEVRTKSSEFGKCYSGYLEWRAEKGAEVTLPAAKP